MPKVKSKTYSFSARLEVAEYGNFTYASAVLTREIVAPLPAGRQRTKGTLNEIPFSLAIQFRKDGRRFFLFSKSLCKAAGVQIGNKVHVSFKLVDPEIVVLPEELKEVLSQDDDARKVWESFSTGLRRSLTLYITPVKTVDGRIKRAIDLANKMKAGQLHVQITRKHKED